MLTDVLSIYTLDSITVWQNPEVIISTSPVCQGDTSDFEAQVNFGDTQSLSSINWQMDGSFNWPINSPKFSLMLV